MRLLRSILSLTIALTLALAACSHEPSSDGQFPAVSEKPGKGWFPLVTDSGPAAVCLDTADAMVIRIASEMLSDDMERVTGQRGEVIHSSCVADLPDRAAVVAGTLGGSRLIDELADMGLLGTADVSGKWESFLVRTVHIPGHVQPVLVVAGSDRRGTAYGLTTLSRAIGVSPWYWWADVAPAPRKTLYVQPGRFVQGEPSVQYRGIFINDERFGGWALWAEQTFDKESGEVGPKTYKKVFELLLRLKGNLLWPAMHNGTRAFNANPENARLADEYAIVMGSSHCEQMLRNNEDEWKNAGTWGDFNYVTNRENMVRYWEERVKANGRYENIYTLGLRGIHDYPMEGAGTTEERVRLMQQAIQDQRDIIRRNAGGAVEDIPQVLCTYEEVLEAYHNGLEVPDDVTLLWSDDKHGYTRNLSNPQERERSGGAGIYYHLSYHGNPASWIWLSPLSPAFVSTELTKAYAFGARKIWVFNVGDIKPAEKEISFAMDLAWDIDRWAPEKAWKYSEEWFSDIFGEEAGKEMADIQLCYYRLMASGKDSHVWFVDYTEDDVNGRIEEWRAAEDRARQLEKSIPDYLKPAYFELLLYPVRGASLLNRYQLLSRRSMVRASRGDDSALEDAREVVAAYHELDSWTRKYNEDLMDGKWSHFFCWRPYHWYYSDNMDAPVATQEMLDEVRKGPEARFVPVAEALSPEGARIKAEREGDLPLWIEAVTPVRNFSKAAEDNEFCTVSVGNASFVASATPVNNVWHSPFVGPMWSKVGTVSLAKGENRLAVGDLRPGTRIDRIFIGLYPPFMDAPEQIIPARAFRRVKNEGKGRISVVRGLGFSDGVLIQPFDTSCCVRPEDAPFVEYEIESGAGEKVIEIRTLPTLHVYEGRDARYAVRIDGGELQVFSIHAEDFTAEWRKNVLQGYSKRAVRLTEGGRHRLRIYLPDPGIVIQEIRIIPFK